MSLQVRDLGLEAEASEPGSALAGTAPVGERALQPVAVRTLARREYLTDARRAASGRGEQAQQEVVAQGPRARGRAP